MDEREIEVVVPGDPRSKARPRFTGSGKVYSSKVQQEHEQAIGWAMRQAVGSRPFRSNVRVEVWFYRSNKQRIDLDNLLKSVLDGANGIAWVDDVQVTSIGARLHLDPASPRTIIRISSDGESTMPRGDANDLHATCETCGREFTWRAYASTPRPGRFCSRECQARQHRTCTECGEDFVANSAAQRFCGSPCRDAWRYRKARVSASAYPDCRGCGRRLKRRGAVYCTKCWHSGRKPVKATIVIQPEEAK